MLLTYSHERFPSLIKAGVKIHTIREDKHGRWKPGMKIHHWMYNPRHTFKNPYPFCKDEKNVCVSVQKIIIVRRLPRPFMTHTQKTDIDVLVDGRHLSVAEIDQLAINDGLNNRFVMIAWFFPANKKEKWWRGKIIHWTNLKY